MQIIRYSDYDSFAWIYNKYWAKISLNVFPILDKLVFEKKGIGANILDLCCGTGQMSSELVRNGYQVTG